MARHRRKKRLQPKYYLRRTLLLLLPLALIGLAVWQLWPKGEPAEPAAPPELQSRSEPEPQSQSEPEPQSQSEPEPQSQSEPEPTETDSWSLILANSTSPLPQGFAPPELETVMDGYQADKRIVEDAHRMFNQAKEDGISLLVCSAYRPEEKQRQLFEDKKEQHIAAGKTEDEAIAATAAAIAYPGTSEHQTGLALDIVTPSYQGLDEGYAETPAAKWLAENAHNYGFVLRYPKNKEPITQIMFEPWHYRYVGAAHAAVIRQNGYCLEEYLYVLAKQEQAQPPDEPAQDASAEQ